MFGCCSLQNIVARAVCRYPHAACGKRPMNALHPRAQFLHALEGSRSAARIMLLHMEPSHKGTLSPTPPDALPRTGPQTMVAAPCTPSSSAPSSLTRCSLARSPHTLPGGPLCPGPAATSCRLGGTDPPRGQPEALLLNARQALPLLHVAQSAASEGSADALEYDVCLRNATPQDELDNMNRKFGRHSQLRPSTDGPCIVPWIRKAVHAPVCSTAKIM